MRKYWTVFTNTLQKALIYRARNVIWAVVNTAPILILISVWSKYYAEGKSISGFSYPQLLSYYFVTIIVSLWTSAIHKHVKEDIKEGELSNYVIKPFNYFWFRLCWEIGWYAIKFVLLAIPLVLFFLSYHPLLLVKINLWSILSLALAYLISFCFFANYRPFSFLYQPSARYLSRKHTVGS